MALMVIEVERRATKIGARIEFLNGQEPLEALTEFEFEWSRQDQEDLRWYLEDYLIYPVDPAPTIAARVEQCIESIGTKLFTALFRSNTNASKVWTEAAKHLADLRVEVQVTEPRLAVLPWELIRDPNSQTVLALSSRSFVRVHSKPSRPLVQTPETDKCVRMLLVICRPGGGEDVPFRSVARGLLKGLRADYGCDVQVDVLRPPTYGQLNAALREASLAAQPYHVVHFDGHGLPGGLVFENPTRPENSEVITGQAIGRLLADTNVPVLVLNACRSAFADPPSQPLNADDIHQDIRAFGSLAHVVADQGVPCVLAMRFNVFVETAARFMVNFYSAMVKGNAVGECVNMARSQLSAEPFRESISGDVRIEDWTVPVVFETKPLQLVAAGKSHGIRHLREEEPADPHTEGLPQPPDAGFFGRDETLFSLDRAFDSENVVLLHAYAGSGKTSTASEFARWYAQTGGTKDLALFTTFATKRTVGQLVDQLGCSFEAYFVASGIQWAAILDPGRRRSLVLEVLAQQSVLWIWDNVEPIAGFPAGMESAWSQEEQTELADFVRDASGRGVKFLLTSRRDESPWLGMLAARVTVPPMPLWERVQLTRALIKKSNRQAVEIQNWRPLLDFTQGNPLALTVLVTQTTRNGLRTASEIARFVSELQTGAAQLRDDPREGRSRSLTASLNYGLEHAFTEDARKAVSLLYFFQGVVNINAFRLLGTGIHALPEVAVLSNAQLETMFQTARELGILEAIGPNAYRIHPAVPWFFRAAFEKYFAGRENACKQIFCLAVGVVGLNLSKRFGESSADAAAGLILEEPNLRYALKLAVQREAWTEAMFVLHGLEDLYVTIQGNVSRWREIVEQIRPFVTDAQTGRAIPGREIGWRAVTEYRMRIARDTGDAAEAEVLARSLVKYWRENAAPFLADKGRLVEGYEEIHNLAVVLESQGNYLGRQGRTDGLPLLEEALQLSLKVGDQRQAAICAQSLGWVYRQVKPVRDLDKALEWFVRGLELVSDDDVALKGKMLVMSGSVFLTKFKDAYGHEQMEELAENARLGMGSCLKALELLPPYSCEDRAEAFLNLGNFCLLARQLPEAEQYFREGLPLARQAGAVGFETTLLANIASTLKEQGRFADAISYAKAAEQNAARMGPSGQQLAILALELLAAIAKNQKAAKTD
jgi:tetratricopeptide (TPR) repeat protein